MTLFAPVLVIPVWFPQDLSERMASVTTGSLISVSSYDPLFSFISFICDKFVNATRVIFRQEKRCKRRKSSSLQGNSVDADDSSQSSLSGAIPGGHTNVGGEMITGNSATGVTANGHSVQSSSDDSENAINDNSVKDEEGAGLLTTSSTADRRKMVRYD